jgi:multimeric flavodoxin WrbA
MRSEAMLNVAVVYHSGYGHTKVLAEAVAQGAPSVDGAKVLLLPVEDAEKHWDDLHAADAILSWRP